MELLKITTSDQGNGVWASTALVVIKDDKHFAENLEAGIIIDSITKIGKTKDEAEANLKASLKEKGVTRKE